MKQQNVIFIGCYQEMLNIFENQFHFNYVFLFCSSTIKKENDTDIILIDKRKHAYSSRHGLR